MMAHGVSINELKAQGICIDELKASGVDEFVNREFIKDVLIARELQPKELDPVDLYERAGPLDHLYGRADDQLVEPSWSI